YGPGLLSSPILGPSILISTGATGLMLRQYLQRPSRAITVIFLICVSLYVLTTQSRGPMLGLAVWVLVSLLINPMYLRRNLVMLGILLLALLISGDVFSAYTGKLIARGSTYR